MSLVQKDARGLVLEGTLVYDDDSGTLRIGNEEELRREGRGRTEPVDVVAEISEHLDVGTRVQIIVGEIR